jgi:hypothetical protein
MIEALRMKGEPKISTRMMVTKERKPRPRNWGLPKLQPGFVSGELLQSLNMWQGEQERLGDLAAIACGAIVRRDASCRRDWTFPGDGKMKRSGEERR